MSANGVCPGSRNQAEYPESDTQCNQDGAPGAALCSEETETLLLKDECKDYVWNSKKEFYYTIRWGLVDSMCTSATISAFHPSFVDKKRSLEHTYMDGKNKSRLVPITSVGEYDVLSDDYDGVPYALGISDLVNTRHRYSWICSLRRRGEDKRHICGVTLLSMPPSPTVLVSSAHCVTICRSKALNKVLDNCCCSNVGGETCTDNPDCGDDPEIVNLTGEDAEIICGEWETGPTPMEESGEEYNIILPIKNITRHPNYTISRGELNSQFVANDLAVFFVEDEDLKQSEYKIVPACLPSGPIPSTTNAIHSGWSSPPPLEFLNQSLPAFVPYYRNFFKQWHYSMSVLQCQDPNLNFKDPSNSAYPPGVICAAEKFNEFCPTSGESGSPLMYEINNKYVALGIESFTKGCSRFTYIPDPLNRLTQESINPSVYSKLSCYLPWIAEQYSMEYEAEDNSDPDCINYSGNIEEVTAEVCTTIPTTYVDTLILTDNVEAECLFNFTLDETEWDGCAISGISDFTLPVFKCPVRTVKNRNTEYFTSFTATNEYGDTVQYNEVLTALYCPTNSIGLDYIKFDDIGFDSIYIFNSDGPVIAANGEYELDPENHQCRDQYGYLSRLPVFRTCKNNCRGGEISQGRTKISYLNNFFSKLPSCCWRIRLACSIRSYSGCGWSSSSIFIHIICGWSC